MRASSRGYLNPDPALRKSCTAPLESAHLFVIFKWRKDRHRRSRGADRPSSQGNSRRKQRAQGKPDARPHPRLVRKKSTRGSHHRFDRIDPAFPARTVLTVSFVLSLVIGLFCYHTPRNAKALSRENLSIERPGPHDFAVRFARFVHSRRKRPSQPAPTFVTIAKRPSLEARAGRD